MSLRLKTYLMLVILLLNQWFAASALASHAMPKVDMTDCAMTHNDMAISHIGMSDMGISDNSQLAAEPAKSAMDCCEQDCTCTVTTCSSPAVLNFDDANVKFHHSVVLLNYQFSSLTAPLSSLQKPPQAQ